VQYVFSKLFKNGHIYDKPVIQYYCEYDDKYLPDRYVIGTCPYCGAPNQYSDLCESCGRVPEKILEPRCAICSRPPVKRESKHYFFRLSSFSDKLRDWLQSNEHLQPEVKNYVINWINEGLQDWDITRDLSWGVPIPLEEAKGKVLYGWFDNHLCYISTLAKQVSTTGKDGKQYWNSSEIYHFIGKDIVYHHYLFLPAMRIGIDEEYRLPDYIPTRGHLMLQNQKISKSRNWYIGLKDFLSQFSADYLRYYIASVVTYSQDDLNFDFDVFYEKINNELIANVGNFVNRALSFTARTFGAKVPEPGEFGPEDRKQLEAPSKVVVEAGNLLERNEIDKALKAIMAYSAGLNQYFQGKSPWSNKETAAATLYVSVNASRSLAILLEPYIPFAAEKIWQQLGLEGSVHGQKWESAGKMDAVKPGHTLGRIEPVFRKIEAKEIEQWKAKLGKR
jgi:methionyl-tRNA synthetase